VISEGSCDTEDWSNDDKFSLFHFTIHAHRKVKLNIYDKAISKINTF